MITSDCLFGLVVAKATTEQEVLCSIARSGKKYYWVFIFLSELAAAPGSGLCPIDGNRRARYFMGLKNITYEMYYYTMSYTSA